MSFTEKLNHTIELLKKAEPLAFSYSDKGFFLAFSGGKDSQALYHVAKLAGVKFEAHYQLTTLDPPELVRFIRSHYPDVIIDRPPLTFFQLCLKKKALPTQLMRFFCAELKETKGGNTITLTGVRNEESTKRAVRREFETIKRDKNKAFRGTIDEFTRSKEVEDVQCIKGKDRIVVNPIIKWSAEDVWHFLNDVAKVEHCELYDRGWNRIGCLFCPMASKREISRHEKLYPKYRAQLLRTIAKLRAGGYCSSYSDLTDEEVFQMWKSKEGFATWYGKNKLQGSLFSDEETKLT